MGGTDPHGRARTGTDKKCTATGLSVNVRAGPCLSLPSRNVDIGATLLKKGAPSALRAPQSRLCRVAHMFALHPPFPKFLNRFADFAGLARLANHDGDAEAACGIRKRYKKV